MTHTDARRLSIFVAASPLVLAVTLATGCWSRVLPTIDFDAGPSAGTGGIPGRDAGSCPDASPGSGASCGTYSSGGSPGMGGWRASGGSSGSGGIGVPSSGNKLDLLFMVDNSMSMAPLQAKMRAQVPAFIDTLRDPTTGVRPDLHVAVVSSSYGGGRWSNVNQCHSAAADPATTGDDQGRFRQGRHLAGGGTPCMMLHPGAKFLETGDGTTTRPNFDGDLSTALGCIADLGDDGCGFESQFESVYAALAKAVDAADPDNAGFLRVDAKLAVVLVTNEDDCSVAANSLLLDPAVNSANDPSGLGALASYRCNEFGHLCSGSPPPHGGTMSDLPAGGVTLENCVSAENNGKTDDAITDPTGSPDPTHGHLWPTVADFRDFVRQLKSNPADIFVAAIAGPTTGPSGESLYHVSPQADPAAMNEIVPVIDHSCTQATADPSMPEYADPAVRIKQWVDSFGPNGAFYPICGPDLKNAMTTIASGIHTRILP